MNQTIISLNEWNDSIEILIDKIKEEFDKSLEELDDNSFAKKIMSKLDKCDFLVDETLFDTYNPQNEERYEHLNDLASYINEIFPEGKKKDSFIREIKLAIHLLQNPQKWEKFHDR